MAKHKDWQQEAANPTSISSDRHTLRYGDRWKSDLFHDQPKAESQADELIAQSRALRTRLRQLVSVSRQLRATSIKLQITHNKLKIINMILKDES